MSDGSIAAAWASLIPHGFAFALRLWYSGSQDRALCVQDRYTPQTQHPYKYGGL